MLGTLAKWLRMLGFDTMYAPPVDDCDLLKTASLEGRALLTRDKNIHSKEVTVLYIPSDDLEEQIVQVLRAFMLEITDPMSRCSLCNAPIIGVKKEHVKGKVPEGVFERQEVFWHCPKCDKYYWKGSHWDKIMERIEKVKGTAA